MRVLDLIARKRDGLAHSPEEIAFLVRSAADGGIPDYQLSAWLMAVCCRGMSEAETVALTRAMAGSGRRLGLGSIRRPKVDKHSTGGVGDGISIALAPLAAAAGLAVPMMSGRGLGHTGGTLDKLESIPGMKVGLPVRRIRSQLARLGACLFGQTKDLAPADRRLYHLRDASATVESPPLVVSSILSKKLSEDLDALVLDVKFGSGAFFQDPGKARELARALVGTAKRLGLKAAALLTSMEQPLGRWVGNACEVRQAVEILQGEYPTSDYREVLLALGGWMLRLGGLTRSAEEGAARMSGLIRDGSGLAAFRAVVKAQGGDVRVIDDPGRLPRASGSCRLAAARSGFVTALEARKVGDAAVMLGAGRSRMDDRLDYGAGIYLERKVGDRVAAGGTLAVLYASDPWRLRQGRAKLLEAYRIASCPPRQSPLVRKALCPEN